MFKDTLKELRQREHLTQSQLAKILGVGSSTIAMYETGRREPTFELLQKIAEYFHVDMNTLMGATVQQRVDQAILDHFRDILYGGNEDIKSYIPTEKDKLIDSISQQLYKLSDDEVKQVLSYAKFLQSKD